MYCGGCGANMSEYPNEERYGAPDDVEVGSLVGWVGAAVSICLLAGVLVWGYQMVMRDVNGIPVVKAVQEPMRVAPIDPGGTPAQNQGFSVNAVAGENQSAPLANRLTLAPSQVSLSDEDISTDQRQGGQANIPGNTAVIEVPAKSIQDMVAEIAAGGEVVNPVGGALREASPLLSSPSLPKAVSGVKRSLRPQLRPGSFQIASLSQLQTASATVVDADPASLSSGTPLVQLGAYKSDAIAKQEWLRFSAKFGPIFDNKQRIVQRASVGDNVFYRLRVVGFADQAAAGRFCSALKAENTECITPVNR